jgi:hypothetical protein
MKYRLTLAFIVMSQLLQAQQPSLHSSDRFYFEGLYTDLRSTHGTHFRGAAIEVGKAISPLFSLWGGIEYSGCPYHDDNGYDLYNVNFIPVYVNEKLKFLKTGKLIPLLDFSQGIAFASYRQELPNDPASAKQIHESGLYVFAGTGLLWDISKKISLLASAGIKSYNITFNNLDVNPHGLAGKIGVVF